MTNVDFAHPWHLCVEGCWAHRWFQSNLHLHDIRLLKIYVGCHSKKAHRSARAIEACLNKLFNRDIIAVHAHLLKQHINVSFAIYHHCGSPIFLKVSTVIVISLFSSTIFYLKIIKKVPWVIVTVSIVAKLGKKNVIWLYSVVISCKKTSLMRLVWLKHSNLIS